MTFDLIHRVNPIILARLRLVHWGALEDPGMHLHGEGSSEQMSVPAGRPEGPRVGPDTWPGDWLGAERDSGAQAAS